MGNEQLIPVKWEDEIRAVIDRFPVHHRIEILVIWEEWLDSNPEPEYHTDWTRFSSRYADQEELFTETRVYVKRIENEIRNREVEKTLWQKAAKAIAAIASFFLVIFLALSRVARGTE